MQGVLNQSECADSRRLDQWIMRASGWKNAGAQHEGGIWDPKPIKLRRGQILYRIGHSKSARGPVPDAVNLSSPWWLEDGTFLEIAISADIVGLERQKVARLKLSVSERFGVFDTIFCVRVRNTIGALRGSGNPVYDPPDGADGSRPIWAWTEKGVMQCFIPGLRDDNDKPTGLAEQAFELIEQSSVGRWRLLDENGAFSRP